jgi:hypothetical protein
MIPSTIYRTPTPKLKCCKVSNGYDSCLKKTLVGALEFLNSAFSNKSRNHGNLDPTTREEGRQEKLVLWFSYLELNDNYISISGICMQCKSDT